MKKGKFTAIVNDMKVWIKRRRDHLAPKNSRSYNASPSDRWHPTNWKQHAAILSAGKELHVGQQ